MGRTGRGEPSARQDIGYIYLHQVAPMPSYTGFENKAAHAPLVGVGRDRRRKIENEVLRRTSRCSNRRPTAPAVKRGADLWKRLGMSSPTRQILSCSHFVNNFYKHRSRVCAGCKRQLNCQISTWMAQRRNRGVFYFAKGATRSPRVIYGLPNHKRVMVIAQMLPRCAFSIADFLL